MTEDRRFKSFSCNHKKALSSHLFSSIYKTVLLSKIWVLTTQCLICFFESDSSLLFPDNQKKSPRFRSDSNSLSGFHQRFVCELFIEMIVQLLNYYVSFFSDGYVKIFIITLKSLCPSIVLQSYHSLRHHITWSRRPFT